MATTKLEPIDYLTLLGYVNELGIKLYNTNQIDCKLTESELLGSGNSMNVYRGDLIENPNNDSCERVPVAIKVPKVKDMNRDKKAFGVLADVRQELRMMKHFQMHPNIISLYGIVFKDLKPLVIVELAENSITDYLAIKKEEQMPIDWETKARFCCEVADGLQALHVAKIVHGDLKGDNILLFNDYGGQLIAKITDFGYSETVASIERGGKTGGSPHFLAPECTIYAPTEMKGYENKPMKDIYAFGLFVWQVAKDGEIPYEELDQDDIYKLKNSDANLDTLLMDLEEDTPHYFRNVIAAMTKYAPEERESLTKVREIMGLDDMNDASYAAARNNLELYATELPRDIAKADLSSIELMSIPQSMKMKIYHNYEKAAVNGDANAMFMIAICHSTGFGVGKDKKKALEWCINAAEAGSLNAMFNIADNYDIRNLSVEPEMAFPWYLKAAEEGYKNAIIKVYSCYYRGFGIEKDEQKAKYWLDKLRGTSRSEVNMNMNIGETSLHRAARLGNVEASKSLLEQGNVNVDAENSDGQTALHIAAQYGHTEIVRLLMTAPGINANAKNTYEITPLELAAGRGHIDVVRLFSDETAITTLNLSNSKLGSSEAHFLAGSLDMYTALVDLDLNSNNIGDSGACALAETLKQSSTLTKLNLAGNDIGDEGTCALAESLKFNSILTRLDLGTNKIGDEGAIALAGCLRQNSSLTQMILWMNNIGDEGACALGECLKHNSTLTQLNLKRNNIGNEGACAFAEGLKLNSALTRLSLISNNISDDGCKALMGCLEQNSTLTQLSIKLNNIHHKTKAFIRKNKNSILQI